MNVDDNFKKDKPKLFSPEDNVKRSGEEIKDLKQYWDDLSYWERDISIKAANEQLSHNLHSQKISPEMQERTKKLLEEINYLIGQNDKERPNKIGEFIGKVFDVQEESYKPNYRICINLLMQLPKLSPETLNALDIYLGIEKDVAKYGRSYQIYNDVLINRTLAKFFAFRNWLGKLYG
jgi:hypothetical protein